MQKACCVLTHQKDLWTTKKKSRKAIKRLIVLRRAGHKHSLCYRSRAGLCLSTPAELAVSWMPLSVLLH